MMLLIAFYAAVLFIAAWTLSAVFSVSPRQSAVLPQQSAVANPQPPAPGRR